MQLLEDIGYIWLHAAAWIAGSAVLFLILTRLSPCNPGQNWWTDRRAALTDLIYWLLLPLLTQTGRVALIVAGSLLIYGRHPPEDFTLRHWPLAAQCLAILLLQDVILYWIHRLFHTRFGWKFHAVHHSPEVLDWTSTQRFHPVNALAEFALADAVVLLMGFSPLALAILGPINLVFSVMVHANLNWTFGRLKHVIASPVFHRWHHTSEEAGLNKNFAPTFPFLDLLFGTFHMPPGIVPREYGAAGVPVGFVGQTIHPFRDLGPWAKRRPVLAVAATLLAAGLGFAGYREATKPLEIVEASPIPAEQIEPGQLLLNRPTERIDATAVAVSAAANRAIFGHTDGRVSLRNLDTNADVEIESHTRRVNAVGFSPDGQLGVSAGGDGAARVFDSATGQHLRTVLPGGSILSAALADDGTLVTANVDGTARVWDARGGLIRSRNFPGGAIHAVAISADASVVACAQSAAVTRWQPTSDRATPCGGIQNLVYCLALRGDELSAGDYDGRVLIWKSGRSETDGPQ